MFKAGKRFNTGQSIVRDLREAEQLQWNSSALFGSLIAAGQTHG